MTELQAVANTVLGASGYLDVFGPYTGSEDEIRNHIKRFYRKLSRILHPDRYNQPADKEIAEQAFSQLTRYRQDADKAAELGRYGQAVTLATIQTRRATYKVIHPLAGGDLSATYLVESALIGHGQAFCKIAKRPADRDLLQTEAAALKRLRSQDADPAYQPFVTELLDSFGYAEAGKPRRQANVIALLQGFYNLDELAWAFPGGLDPLHMAWIWRRLLVSLGHAHDNNVVHGAVLPQHVMVHPAQHGVVLADWCYASIKNDGDYPLIAAIVDEHKDWYPDEVLAKQPPSPATDIVMAARCMIHLMGGNPLTGNLPANVPKPFRAFFRGCLQANCHARPDNAWLLLKEFDELLEEMGSPYYPRRFRPLTMPSGMA